MGTSGSPLQYVRQLLIIWVHSFIEPDLFDNNVPFHNTFLIYLIHLLWKLGLGLWLDLGFHYFSIFHETKTNTLSSTNFMEGNILLKECTQMIDKTK